MLKRQESKEAANTNGAEITVTATQLPSFLKYENRNRYTVVADVPVVVRDNYAWAEALAKEESEKLNQIEGAKVSFDIEFREFNWQNEGRGIFGKILVQIELTNAPKFPSEKDGDLWFSKIQEACAKVAGTEGVYISVLKADKESKEISGISVLTTAEICVEKGDYINAETWLEAYKETGEKVAKISVFLSRVRNTIEWYNRAVSTFEGLREEFEEAKANYFELL